MQPKIERRKMTECEWIEIFSNNLTEIIAESGYSQNEVAKMTNIPQPVLSRYVNGRVIPSVVNIIKLSYALNCDIRELIDFGDIID